MKNLNLVEIKIVNGGDLSCPKTAFSTISAICVGLGSSLQAWGQSIHVAVPDLADKTQTAAQRKIGMGISIAGMVLNGLSLVLAGLSSAEETCDISTNTTTPNP